MTQRFEALDGLRGLCALAVLEFHLALAGGGGLFRHGYLAVDIFFLISGVVLAAAYDAKFAAGLTATDFLRARVRRLAPVLWVGLGACAAGFGAARLYNHDPMNLAQGAFLLRVILQNAFLIPLLSAHAADAFPLDGASWSLFAELIVNAAFALAWRHLGNRSLLAIVIAGYGVTALLALATGSGDFGARQANVLLSVPRAVPSFAMGVLLLRHWRAGGLAWLPALPPLPVMALFLLPLVALPAHFPVIGDILLMVVGWPLLVALLLRRGAAMPRWLRGLGALSYPLYASHPAIVNFVLATGILGARGHLSPASVAGLSGLALLLAFAVKRAAGSRQVADPAIGKRLGDVRPADGVAAG